MDKYLEIVYSLKHTAAKTQYVEIQQSDKAQLLHTLTQAHLLMSQLCAEPNIKSEGFEYAQAWLTRTKDLHRGRAGLNSPMSMVTGVLYNMTWGKQRDFTHKQIEDLEICLLLAHSVWPEHLPEVVFSLSDWA